MEHPSRKRTTRQVRERRTHGLRGRALKHGMILVPESALVTAQAEPRTAAHPLISLHDRGERGAPQPKAQNPEHTRQAQAKAEKWVMLSSIGQAKPPQIFAQGGALGRTGARANITILPASVLARGVQAHNIRNRKQGQAVAVDVQREPQSSQARVDRPGPILNIANNGIIPI